jgi:hypothetical protein
MAGWVTAARVFAVGLSIGGPLTAFFVFWGGVETGEYAYEVVAATAVAILVSSLGGAGLLCAVDGRGVRGALGVLAIPVAAVTLLVVLDFETWAEEGALLDAIPVVGIVFVVVAAPLEAGYLIGRFAAWLIGMRTAPKA